MTDTRRTLTHPDTGGVATVSGDAETFAAYEGLGWVPVSKAVGDGSGPTKAELLAAAERADIAVPPSATKADIAALLDGANTSEENV